MTTLIYLHGFLSSPQSSKALLTKDWLHNHYPAINYACPALSSYPAEAKAQLLALMEQLRGERLLAIGSSLGGFWATWLVEQGFIEKAVLVNPAVMPHSRFDEFVGVPLQSYYSDAIFTLGQKDIQDLGEMECSPILQVQKYWLMLQKGDETLDYRLAEQKYAQCEMLIEDGGSHTFEGFEHWLPAIARFFGLPQPT